MRLALAVSIALHVVGLAWATRHEAKPVKPVAAQPVTPPAPAPAPEPAPIDVVVLDTPRDTPSVSHVTSHDGEIAMATTVHAPEVQHPTAPPESHPPVKHSPLMTMREPTIGQPLDDIFDQIANGPAGPVAPNLDSQKWIDHATADEVNAARAAREAEREARENDDLHPNGRGAKGEREAFKAKVASDGTVHFDNTPDFDIHFYGLGFAGHAGWDDAIMRSHGEDPYASAKRQWLEKTFDERAALGLANRKEELARSADYMRKNLAWMWQKTSDAAERKEALFEMWDEVAETGDDDLIRGGQAAREYLIGFIRTRLPAGSAGAFSDAEISQLNAHRHSHAVFAPYE